MSPEPSTSRSDDDDRWLHEFLDEFMDGVIPEHQARPQEKVRPHHSPE